MFPGDVRYDGPTTVNAGSLVLSFSNTSMLSALTVNGGILRATTSGNALGSSSTRNTITLAGGALELANNTGQTFGSTSRITTVSGNATIRSDRLAAGAGVTHTLGPLRIGAQTLSVSPGAIVTSGTAGMTFGATTLSGNATFNVVNSGSANAQLTLGAVGQSGGARSLTKTGNGTLLLNGAGSYTGQHDVGPGRDHVGSRQCPGQRRVQLRGRHAERQQHDRHQHRRDGAHRRFDLESVPGRRSSDADVRRGFGTCQRRPHHHRLVRLGGRTGHERQDHLLRGHRTRRCFSPAHPFRSGWRQLRPGALGAGGELHPAGLATVPSVVNLTQAAATTAINDAGLVVGTVATAASATVAAGSVISQDPSAGASVASGSAVSLVVSSGAPPANPVFGDFDGDGSTDFAVWRSATGGWFVEGTAGSTSWGKAGDIPVVGDFDGDGTTDIAVFRPGNGRWYVNGIAGSTQWGVAGDVPVPGDYDGDGTTDFAVYRPSTHRWFIEGIGGSTQWGKDGDVVVPGDYDGDGTTDVAVWRPANGRWYVAGVAGSTQWGVSTDTPVPGDYDGDGTTDFAVYRPSTGRWYIEGIAGNTQWGKPGDVVVPGDYDGDGTTDIAVWRPANGRWYVDGIAGSTQWGVGGQDTPVIAPIHMIPGLLGI